MHCYRAYFYRKGCRICLLSLNMQSTDRSDRTAHCYRAACCIVAALLALLQSMLVQLLQCTVDRQLGNRHSSISTSPRAWSSQAPAHQPCASGELVVVVRVQPRTSDARGHRQRHCTSRALHLIPHGRPASLPPCGRLRSETHDS